MKRLRWLVVALALFVAGIGSITQGWNGNANVTMAWPPAGTSVTFCGSAHGWPAWLGVVTLLLGGIFLIVGIVSAATASTTERESGSA